MKYLILLAITIMSCLPLQASSKRHYIDVDCLYMNNHILYFTSGKKAYIVKALRFRRGRIYVFKQDLVPFKKSYIRYPMMCGIR